MNGIKPMNKRGGKEYAQETTGSGNSTNISGAFYDKKVSPNGAGTPSRTDNASGVKGSFYEGRGGKEYATKVDSGTGYSK